MNVRLDLGDFLEGLHIKYEVQPDIAMYGKAMGNGYAITAVVGKEEIMNSCQDTFISSTFWTEEQVQSQH